MLLDRTGRPPAPGNFFRRGPRTAIMVRAFIMVKADTGHAEMLLDTIEDLEHVADSNIIAGDFDVIVEAEADEVYQVINAVATEIRSLEAVNDTKTYVCLE